MDRYLDTTDVGPMFLRQEEVLAAVVESLHRGVGLGHYLLGAWTIMSNHVHVLLLPKMATPSRMLQSFKGSSQGKPTAFSAVRVSGFGRPSRTTTEFGTKPSTRGLWVTSRKIL